MLPLGGGWLVFVFLFVFFVFVYIFCVFVGGFGLLCLFSVSSVLELVCLLFVLLSGCSVCGLVRCSWFVFGRGLSLGRCCS